MHALRFSPWQRHRRVTHTHNCLHALCALYRVPATGGGCARAGHMGHPRLLRYRLQQAAAQRPPGSTAAKHIRHGTRHMGHGSSRCSRQGPQRTSCPPPPSQTWPAPCARPPRPTTAAVTRPPPAGERTRSGFPRRAQAGLGQQDGWMGRWADAGGPFAPSCTRAAGFPQGDAAGCSARHARCRRYPKGHARQPAHLHERNGHHCHRRVQCASCHARPARTRTRPPGRGQARGRRCQKAARAWVGPLGPRAAAALPGRLGRQALMCRATG